MNNDRSVLEMEEQSKSQECSACKCLDRINEITIQIYEISPKTYCIKHFDNIFFKLTSQHQIVNFHGDNTF